MSKPRIYLAGPISGLTYDGATSWRDYVSTRLAPNVECRSPMRNKDYLKQEGILKDSYEGGEWLLSTNKFIVARDRNDVYQSDLILVNFLGASKVSAGTFIEIGWANAWNKPIVAVIDDDNYNKHAMGDEMTLQVPTLEEGLLVVKTLLNIH